MKDIKEFLEFAKELALKAGEIQMSHFRHGHLHLATKLNDADVVTIADKESENYIISEITSRYPDHSILSEESGEHTNSAEWRWVIDPLDGTTNYSQGLPVFCVSIALQHNGESVAGVVYAPYLHEFFYATKGGGAWLGDHQLHCSKKEEITKLVATTGIPVDKNVNPDNNIDNLSRVVHDIRGLRILGSAALDLCYVAAGFTDIYWEMNIHLWDVAAGRLIAEEAGAEISSFRQDRGVAIIAAAPAISDIVRPLIK